MPSAGLTVSRNELRIAKRLERHHCTPSEKSSANE